MPPRVPLPPTNPATGALRGYYSGDSNYNSSSDTSTDECFDVAHVNTSTATTPTKATITLGQSNTDSATVTGNPSRGPPTGTVTFYVCGPTATPTACTSQADQVGSLRGLDRGGRRHLECHLGFLHSDRHWLLVLCRLLLG